jgi:hypothetical protein
MLSFIIKFSSCLLNYQNQFKIKLLMQILIRYLLYLSVFKKKC